MRNEKQREKNVHCILTAKTIKELFNFRIQEQCQFSSNVLVAHEVYIFSEPSSVQILNMSAGC